MQVWLCSKYIQKARQSYSKAKQSKDDCQDKFLLIILKLKTVFILALKFLPLLLKVSPIANPAQGLIPQDSQTHFGSSRQNCFSVFEALGEQVLKS